MTSPNRSATSRLIAASVVLVASCASCGTDSNPWSAGSSSAGSTQGLSAGTGAISIGGVGATPAGSDGSLAGTSEAEAGGLSGDHTGGSGSSSFGEAGSSGATAGSSAGATNVGGSTAAGEPGAPTGLMIELTTHPELMAITDATPELSWIVNASGSNAVQSAYQVLVASSEAMLAAGTGDLWNSGKIASAASVDVAYAGKALTANATAYWKVQTWDGTDKASGYSVSQKFGMAASLTTYRTPTPSVVQTPVVPQVMALGTGRYFLDFGRAAFGWLELTFNAPMDGAMVTVNLGEKAKGQAVDLSPGESIRYASVQLTTQKGMHTYRVNTPANARNTSFPAIALPASLGVVMPFRYVEITGAPVTIDADSARQIAVSYPFDDTASAFSSSSSALDEVWALAKYTIKATTFADIYIDGDRERRPYEGDAHLQQLGHYGVDRDYAIARASHEYLMTHSTWPTEWKLHSIMLAWWDWMYTGNTESLAQQYALLKKEKTFEAYMNSDGLLSTGSLLPRPGGPDQGDVVDWPKSERDGYVFTDVNTVVNSFWCYTLGLMADIASVLGNESDATRYRTMQTTATAALNSKLFSTSTGLYVDGQSTTHSTLHANLFPLAFGLVPADRAAKVVTYVKSRGMACSVYGAQYLLEGLYRQHEPDAALALLTATGNSSWLGMISAGSTLTMETWPAKFTSNYDWNHAWGAAPANILPRFILGVQPLKPGFAQALIEPQPGSLTHVEGTVPTVRGPIRVSLDAQPFQMSVSLPGNMTANLGVPSTAKGCAPLLDGKAATVTMTNGAAFINGVGSGQHLISCQ